MKKVTIPAQFASHLKFAANLCTTDTLRPAMTGVFIEVRADHIQITGTDAHRLMTYRINQPNADIFNVIIPAKTVKAGVRLKTDTVLVVDGENVTVNDLQDRVIDARYPDYQCVIPQDPPVLFDADRETLLRLVKAAALGANQITHHVNIEMSPDASLKLSGVDIDYSCETVCSMGVLYLPAGGELPHTKFAVNGNLLASILDQYPAKPEYVRFKQESTNRGITISCNDANLVVLLYPLMINV